MTDLGSHHFLPSSVVVAVGLGNLRCFLAELDPESYRWVPSPLVVVVGLGNHRYLPWVVPGTHHCFLPWVVDLRSFHCFLVEEGPGSRLQLPSVVVADLGSRHCFLPAVVDSEGQHWLVPRVVLVEGQVLFLRLSMNHSQEVLVPDWHR